MLGRRSKRVALRSLSVLTVSAVIAGLSAGLAVPAGASSGPWSPTPVTADATTHVLCRAYGGSLSANTEADQDLGFTVTAPDGVHEGDTFNIKIQPGVSLYPRTDSSTGTTATILAIYNQISKWQLPASLSINSVSLAPVDGNTTANPDAGYYVDPANVPHSTVSGVGDIPNPDFDPLTLPAAQRLAVPGIAPAAFFDPVTRVVRIGMLGTGTESAGTVFAGGSAVQPPALTVNVTANSLATPGTDLSITTAGHLPAGSFTGGQPGNFPAPTTIAVNQTTVTSSDSTWTDPSYVNYVYTSALGGLIKIVAKAACAPGWEATGTYPTAPTYMTGPGALANGVAPPLSHTKVVGIETDTPFEGASYVTGQSVPADYTCLASPTETYDSCVGDIADGALLDTSTPGSYTFTINATDAFASPLTKTVHYTVVDNTPPVPSSGANQTGKIAGNTITLDASATTDIDGPPAQPITYTWAQVANGAPTVALSDTHAVKPTFVVPPVTNPAGYTFQFTVTADDNNGGVTTSSPVSVTAAASTPTVTVAKTRIAGGTTFTTGDDVSLSANITNPDGTAEVDYTYAWNQTGGRTTALSSTTAAHPTYRIPSSGANPTTAACTSGAGAVSATSANCPTYAVVVTKTNTAKSSTSATLANYSSSLPARPVANAGVAQNIPSAGGLVTLDGSASAQTQTHALTYAWTQTGGPAVTLSDATAQKPTFTAPPGGPTSTAYAFSLTVVDSQSPIVGSGTNGNTSTAATTSVTVVPDHVVASHGPDQTGKVAGNTITLDASASTDPNLAPLSYTWTQVSNGAPTATLSDPHAVKPTFVAPPAAAPTGYVAQFNVTATNNGPNPTDTDTTASPVSITVGASTPTATVAKARAGGGTTFFVGDDVTLSANITNPDGTAEADYTYAWTQSGGRTTALSSNTVAHPVYRVPSSGANPTAAVCTSGAGAVSPTSANCPTYVVVVTKTNTAKSSGNATLANYAATLPARPTASAGAAQGVKVGATPVTLDGSASAQTQGHALSYAWTQTGGTPVALSSTTAQKPTFTAPSSPTSLSFSLTVVDSQSPITGSGTNGNTSTAATTSVTVTTYAAPDMSAGTDQSVNVDDAVTLHGSASQSDGHSLSLLWTQTSGATVSLSDPTAAEPTFAAPTNGPDDLGFTLTVVDPQNPDAATNTRSASVVVHVLNGAPVADAGTDATSLVNTHVSLDGSASFDPDGQPITYTWAQTGGAAVVLSNVHAVQPGFTTPATTGTLTFTLTVDDGHGLSSVATVHVNVGNDDPVANAGPDQSGKAPGSTVTLDASASADPNPGQTLSYAWTQLSGPSVTLSDDTAAMPTFAAPVGPVSLSFQVVVDDGFGGTDTDSVTVNVTGFAGVDLSGSMTGMVKGHLALSKFRFQVKNQGSVAEAITSADINLHVSINGTPVAPGQLVIGSKSATLKAGKTTPFAVTWNHGSSLHAGDNIVVQACIDLLGDSTPANNCGAVLQPTGTTNLSSTLAVSSSQVTHTQTTNRVLVTVTNVGTALVTPLRGSDIVITVSVNGGAPQSVTSINKTMSLKPGKKVAMGGTWSHAALSVGSVVVVQSCTNVPGNVGTACNSVSYTVK